MLRTKYCSVSIEATYLEWYMKTLAQYISLMQVRYLRSKSFSQIHARYIHRTVTEQYDFPPVAAAYIRVFWTYSVDSQV
jgi:hypothetical protein